MRSEPTRDEFEEHIVFLLRRNHALRVSRECRFKRKTPDILIHNDEKSLCIVECTSINTGARCNQADHRIGDRNPNELQERLYASIVKKIEKYTPEIIGKIPLVIAIRNDDCSHQDLAIYDVVTGASRFVNGVEQMMWCGEYRFGIFGNPMYRHCSGVIHASGSHDYLFVRNPNATNPTDEGLFEFAQIAQSERYNQHYRIDASSPVASCPNSLMQIVRNEEPKIHLPGGGVITLTSPTAAPTVNIVGTSEDGKPLIELGIDAISPDGHFQGTVA